MCSRPALFRLMPLLTELRPFPRRRRYKQVTPTEFGKLSAVEKYELRTDVHDTQLPNCFAR
jgi:hypothetical protein